MRAPADEGFTLVEMLVSLAILGVASALMAEGFSASRGALGRLRAHDRDTATVASAEMRLRAALERMAVRARFDAATPYVEIDGDTGRLDFAAAAPPGASTPVEAERLSLSPDGDLVLGPAADGPPAPDRVLLHDAASLDIAYFGRDGSAAGWRDDWVRQPSPPELVRVRVGFARGDRRGWPELIVRPAAEVDNDCVIDADTAQCRGRA